MFVCVYIYIYILKVKTGDGLTSLFTIQKPRLEFLESKLTNTKIPIILFTVCMCVYIYIYYIKSQNLEKIQLDFN